MRILYGVQGTGNGHITRARHLAAAFNERDDISVDYLFSGRPRHRYFDMEVFGKLQFKQGLTFFTSKGQVNYLKTITHNNLSTLCHDVNSLDLKQYDLVINDFEPISAWAAKKNGVPSIALSHQAAFLEKVPVQQQSILDKQLTKYFAPAQFTLGTHWYHFGSAIAPPFVSKELIDSANHVSAASSKPKQILVYLPFEELSDIHNQLKVLSDWHFMCFHPKITHKTVRSNVTWCPPSNQAFKQALVQSAGVIANCGYELSTECLSIGKPLLVKPLHKQFEQISNAYTLYQLGLCELINELNSDSIDDWLQQMHGAKIGYPSDCTPLVDWIASGEWEDTQSISSKLWQSVTFPNTVKARLDRLTSANN